jgi:invasion protein IalB
MPARSFNLSRTTATVAAALCVAISALALVGAASAAKRQPKPPATWTNTLRNWKISCANYYTMYSADTKAGDNKAADEDLQIAQNAGCPWAT